MGAEQSNTKSSLLRNFQYLVVQDKQKGTGNRTQYKLMYFDYLKFLKYEIDNEAWKWDIYKKHVNGGSTTDNAALFCGWKDIQKEIFDKLNEQLEQLQRAKSPTQKIYKWEEDALPLINIGEKKLNIKPNCSITIDVNNIDELKKPEFPAVSGGTSITNCGDLKTAPNLHIPLRRRALLVEGIDEYIGEINKKIMSEETLRQAIESNVDNQTHIEKTAVDLKKEMIDGLGTGLSKLIREKYEDAEHDAFCKEWQLTMEDYHTLFLGKDIVDEKETTKIQCTIKLIEQKVGKKANFQKKWSSYFKALVRDLQTEHLKDPKTSRPCDITYENKTQCIRFFKEWAEEFCKLKKDLGEMIVENCKDNNNANSSKCKNVCNIYKRFLTETKPYYDNYKHTCDKPPFGNNDDVKDLQQNFIDAVSKSMNECCKENGNCTDQELFQVTNDKGNIIYNCMCPEGTHTSKKDKPSDCQKVINAHGTLTGTQVAAQQPVGMSHSVSSSAACGIHSGKQPSAKVETIAKQLQAMAKTQSTSKVGNVDTESKSVLIGKPEKGTYKDNKNGNDLANGGLCNLDKKTHTNDKRQYQAGADGSTTHDGPCTGKGGGTGADTRFEVGVRWETKDSEVNTNHQGLLLPLRRRHICTSNLENLEVEKGALSEVAKVNNSFLGDVLLSAKYEAEKIIEQYKQKNNLNGSNGQDLLKDPKNQNHRESICRAMRYSFADFGDIIRGRDLWSRNTDMEKIETNLKAIFQKINENTSEIKEKYDNENGQYSTLRSDWWEANRDKVWEAMQCELKKLNITTGECKYNPPSSSRRGPLRGPTSTPLDDYIPQKLRWLAEWAEWYCKTQKKHYMELQSQCGVCINGNGKSCDSTKCAECRSKCDAYKAEIAKWEKDWEKQKNQYKTLYTNAQTSSSTPSNDENQKYLNEFLQKLQKENTGNNIYDSAEGYIQQELKTSNVCEKQKDFCNSGSNQYTFSPQPSDYKIACECDSSTPCQILDTILKGKTATDAVVGCKAKTGEYKWGCEDSKFESGHKDACMPPRRQKLCINNLKDLNGNDKTPNELKKALIQCAAAETFFAWNKYKTDHIGVEDELKNQGKIPEEFKRQMMYTLGDFRDLVFDTDISKQDENTNEHVTKARKNIKNIFEKNGTPPGKKIEPKVWWNDNAPHIWEGMLCGLSHTSGINDTERAGVKTKLENTYGYDKVTFSGTTTPSSGNNGLAAFASRPQFLRWLTEWGEHFCKKHKKEYDQLKEKCDRCNASNPTTPKTNSTCDKKSTECTDCQTQCQEYQKFITQWKPNYEKQKKKYTQDKNKADYKTDSEVQKSQEAHDYINKQIKKICTNSGKNIIDCSCMEQKSSQNTSGGNNMPKSLEDPPSEYKNQCECEQKPPELPKCTHNKILDAANNLVFQSQRDVHKHGDVLRGDLSQAKFKHKNNPTPLDRHGYCNFELQKHGNDVRSYTPKLDPGQDEHNGPCTGKGKNQGDQRFIIGQEWKPGENKDMRDGHKDVLLPPRRKHMCTSNLENLGKSGDISEFVKTAGNNVNDTFLGDVLLAAKFEGDDIVEKHLSKSDKSGICNAMKYSFADLGDIIRGKDLWSGNKDMVNLQKYLTAIFKKIHENLPAGTKEKYNSGPTETPPYKTLREHWWSANRDQVWKALTCSAPDTADLYTRNSSGEFSFHRVKCGRDSYTPPDDYIPQRLRWMTEWSESYCKQLERNFWWVKAFCHACKKNIAKGKPNDTICDRCVKNCQVYTEHVNKWKGDWKKQEQQYRDLYNGTGTTANDEIKKEHKNFLEKVKKKPDSIDCTGAKTDNNEYKSLSDYVTSMGGSTYCNDTTQKKFVNTSSQDTESVFRQNPNKYDTECVEENKPKPPKTTPGVPGFLPPKSNTDPDEICKTVKQCIQDNEAKEEGQKDCNPKIKGASDTSYPKWECTDPEKQKLINSGDQGACMPPRRQKLCLYYLAHSINSSSDKEKLKDAFIKSAALETYFAWDKYKKDKKNEDPSAETKLDEQLKNGIIPEEFLRSIFFTYGDFKDLCLDKDIGKKNPNGDVEKATNNITAVLKKINRDTIDEQKRKEWWDNNGLDIWQGMLCSLSHAIKDQSAQSEIQQKLNDNYKYDPNDLDKGIAKYVLYSHTTPQFLRWYTEWSEEFCDKQKKEFAQLYSKCYKCEVNSSGNKITCKKSGTECSQCQTQCPKYTKFIEKWKRDWDKQNQHYTDVKDKDPYDSAPFVDTNTHAYTYLNESLELLGLHDNCMKNTSTSTATSGSGGPTGGDMPQALDEYPSDEYKNKCDCQEDTSSSVQPDSGGTSQGGGGSHGGQPQGPMPDPKPGGTQDNICDKVKGYITDNDSKKIGTGGCKDKDDADWNCDKDKFENQQEGPCMSGRRQKMCLHYLQYMTGTSQDELKDAVMKCVSLETHLLWQKYIEDKKKDNPSEATKLEEQLKKGNIPPEFKRRMFYTYSDYRDIFLGKDIGNKIGAVGAARTKIDNILKPKIPKSGITPQQPENWWSSIEQEVWNAMLCSLSYDGTKVDAGTQKKLAQQNKYSDVTFDGKTKLDKFVERPQFLRWLTEWYDDYCKQKQKRYDEVKDTCKKVGDTNFQCENKDCKQKCKAYTDFMEERKGHWEKQKDYYEQQEQKKTSGYSESDATKYLQKNFTVKCGDNSSGTPPSSGASTVEKNINALTQPPPQIYDVDEYCGCKKFIGDDKNYDTISKQDNCKGLMKDINGGTGIKWQNTDDTEYSGFKDKGVSNQVYIPPRRQRICFQDIDGTYGKVKDQNSLREQLMKVAATEGHNLGEYYKKKKENETGTPDEQKKYAYDVEACNAMKYSFLDLRDIILGTDNLEIESNGTETNLQKIFKSGKQSGSQAEKPGSQERKKFWEENKDCVWNAMKCGYKKSGDTKDVDKCDMPDDATYPVADNRTHGTSYQFLRWFAEWGEDYCKKHHVEKEKLEKACSNCKGNGQCKDCSTCQTQCGKYQAFIGIWKPQYDKQKEKFKTDQSSYEKDTDAKTAKDARDFLDRKLTKMCSNSGQTSGTNSGCNCMNEPSSQQPTSGTHIPKSLDQIPDSVKDKCGCATSQVVPPVPNPAHPSQDPASGQHSNTPSPSSPKPGDPKTDPNGGSGGPNGGSGGPNGGTQPSGGGEPDPGNQPVTPVDPSSGPNVQPSGGNTGQGGGTPGTNTGNQNPGEPDPGQSSGKPNDPGVHPPGGNPKTPTDPFKELDECPLNDNNACTKIGNAGCPKKKQNYDLDKWETQHSTHSNFKNKTVLVPPRRKNICFSNINLTRRRRRINNEHKFTKYLLDAAAMEAKLLREQYKTNKEKTIQAMKYSFADYGNIIKGDDLLEDLRTKNVKEIFEKICKKNNQCENSNTKDEEIKKKRQTLWDNNKKKVWNAMLCGYKKAGGQIEQKDCELPDDNTDQFLRWLEEWARIFCDEKKKEAEEVVKKCLSKIKGTEKSLEHIIDSDCKKIFRHYKSWYIDKNAQWKDLKDQYTQYKQHYPNGTAKSSGNTQQLQDGAEKYITSKCPKCDCNYNDLEKISKYENDAKELYKQLIKQAKYDTDTTESFLKNILTIGGYGPKIVTKAIEAADVIIPQAAKTGVGLAKDVGIPVATSLATTVATNVLSGLGSVINWFSGPTQSQNKPSHPANPAEPDSGTSGGNPPPTTPQTTPAGDILTSTLPPVGITFVLGAIGFLWFFMKKKPQLGPTKLFRVLDIPQNDYSIPTEKASNRYIPYGKYKGKTYIYVEGEETDDYLRDISSSDLTSSSESEFEELDINDIYGYKSPKYKTLIEVVLKPSSKTTYDDTYKDNIVDTSDTPINKLTDNEWNEVKHDFISQYLNNIGNDVPLNNELQSYNNPKDTQPDILDVSSEEKPFITSIQDRKLYSNSDITYNIDWNIPENIRTNNVDSPKYVSPNLYSGIDLINDSLNNDKHIDIYDELLKRKENELFGTKYTKKTNSNIFAKQIYDDPILNQIELFDKWLDRHRDMLNKWNNKEEMLSKLNDEWNKENKEHLLYTSTHDDIQRINDETHGMINTNNLYDDSNI
ncbi:erythrocyte membrane protein 1, PfEMP1, putative [Plasmodium sp. gorilla clade G2]|uniref:erythrocyte membrane protein 1, PfEMP1, putative n=1 Tax=Plasmodium sp. gorilla clade G2 TaxID=880535 RepID=UPI000D28658B|nr:erythrocyte membrane protein 1, PfEMP1, putative [Plasmodium sp. gorilla clade G2]SOV20146.1 erythrocyte membrane protein 1, PfEMP1, putative [Plasmodium sp. gorilla clade G2]